MTPIAQAVLASFARCEKRAAPYPHALLDHMLPDAVAAALDGLPFPAPRGQLDAGTREANNATRVYFDAANMARFPLMREVAQALQSDAVVRGVSETFGAPLEGTYLRLEYAQDCDGFWLQPHTDLGVKKFTLLIYLSAGDGHETLGTDIYSDKDHHVGRSPFRRNAAMAFVPGADTWHGFEKRPIAGIRRSVILNYVSPEWRAREQLSFPETPIHLA